jgi:uncharacterized protein (TIGR02594 family)
MMHPSPLNWQQPLHPWLAWAFIEMCKEVKEMPKRQHHPRIIDYHSYTTMRATEDEVAWCSSFVNAAMHECGLPGTLSAAARSWVGYGLELSDYKFGAIAVFWRGDPDGWQGHVGFAVKETPDSLLILGGNQGNRLCLKHYMKDQLLSLRWPDEYNPRDYYPLEEH